MWLGSHVSKILLNVSLTTFFLFFFFSNKLGKEKQNEFLVELLTPVREMWLGDKLQGLVTNVL